MKILVIIPAYNEALNIERVVENLIHNYPQYDYVIVNDGSKDSTADICRKNGYNLLDLPINLGLSGAVQAGMRYAARMGYDAAVQFDGDGQHKAEYIGVLAKEMSVNSAKIVIGSRFVTEKKAKSLRMLGNTILSFIIKVTTGYRMTDPTSGMRMFDKEIVNEFAMDMNYGPEPDTVSYLIKQGITVKEVQVEMDERIAGESYLNLVRSVKYMVLMSFSILFVQWFRKGRH
ncbi:glycosyltransferase family 2 protein [Thomasclavelia cocleata]|uniref:glycosyltransferase family 2 protein n=1 Tax=Thomasclavelia cocleata TaxID=69824 RepID=UPI0025A015D0|nr:glycosyltransferase family 2 protein [Thomasclavelia cocleata]MCX4374681.1 glycosyltransferase family 2 protein [Lachnospiraceae bacterium]